MAQLSNQFSQTPEKGQLTGEQNLNILNARVITTASSAITSAEAVKLVDTASGVTVVEAVSAATDAVFGFRTYDIRDDDRLAGEMCKIAFDNTIIYLEAGAAIATGALVQYQPTGKKVITRTTGTVCGIALDKATADADLIRVLLKTPLTA